MLRYLTLVRRVTYMDRDGDLMIKLNSFIFSEGGGKSTQTNYFCSGTIELWFDTIINYLTHSCEAADVTNGSEMPPLCYRNPEFLFFYQTHILTSSPIFLLAPLLLLKHTWISHTQIEQPALLTARTPCPWAEQGWFPMSSSCTPSNTLQNNSKTLKLISSSTNFCRPSTLL